MTESLATPSLVSFQFQAVFADAADAACGLFGVLPKDRDLNEPVAGLQSMLARLIREDIALSCVLAPEPAMVRVDPRQIEQAILNLVLNARDALPGGGFIRLEVARVIPPQLETGVELAPAAGEC